MRDEPAMNHVPCGWTLQVQELASGDDWGKRERSMNGLCLTQSSVADAAPVADLLPHLVPEPCRVLVVA